MRQLLNYELISVGAVTVGKSTTHFAYTTGLNHTKHESRPDPPSLHLPLAVITQATL